MRRAPFLRQNKCARTLSRGGAVGRVNGLILPVGLHVGLVVKGAEQVGAARLELELGGDVTERTRRG